MVHRVPCHFHAQLQLAKICSLPLNGCSQIPPHNKHYTHCLTSDSQITHPISNFLYLSNFIIIIIVILLHPIRGLHTHLAVYITQKYVHGIMMSECASAAPSVWCIVRIQKDVCFSVGIWKTPVHRCRKHPWNFSTQKLTLLWVPSLRIFNTKMCLLFPLN